MSDRNLGQIINSIVAVAPDLEPYFRSLRESVNYTAPELMGMRWGQASDILNEHAIDHEQQVAIGRIFSGTGEDDETKTD